jgi:SAM-dependent methyltransferase
VGADLTRRTALADRVEFRHGNARALPFADASFDIVWTQHSSMNIDDKATLYAEAHRVLRRLGFRVVSWEDHSAITVAWFRERIAAAGPGGPPPLGLQLLLGADTPRLFGNMIRSFEEARIAAVMTVMEKPGA